MNKATFVNLSKAKFGSNFDYSLIPDKVPSRIDLICNKHGVVNVYMRQHLVSKTGCTYCSNKKANTEIFVEKANLKHNHKYDYSKTTYKRMSDRVVIICPVHGEFEQFANIHLKGGGCNKCHLDSIRKTTNEFINEAKQAHGNKYDYSKTVYTNAFDKVTIICPVHGEFQQSASDHTNKGSGCSKCAVDNIKNTNWLNIAKLIHNNKYDYSKVAYANLMEKVTIICPDHGEFKQRINCHVHKKQGCPNCPLPQISRPQQEIIYYIKSIYKDEIIINDRKILPNQEIDIYFPKLKLGIEYNGLYWHSGEDGSRNRSRHKAKVNLCDSNNINLFSIWENEWSRKQDIIKSMISNKLGLSNKIFARKCEIKELNNEEYRIFIISNHLQGYANAIIKYGLVYNSKIVSVIGFNRHLIYEWEISRIATLLNTNVVGGVSRLLNHFIKHHNPKQIMSYANRNHSNGNVYKTLGFAHICNTEPGYHYCRHGIVYSRQQFQKHKLHNKLENFDPSLSESQNMFNNGYRKFYDCGNMKFVKICQPSTDPSFLYVPDRVSKALTNTSLVIPQPSSITSKLPSDSFKLI